MELRYFNGGSVMDKNHNSNKLMNFCNQVFCELYVLDTLVKMTKEACEDREYNGQYYGIPVEKINKLSVERNNYINMLTLLSEKINRVMNINLQIEEELTLEQNPDNCSRQVTT